MDAAAPLGAVELLPHQVRAAVIDADGTIRHRTSAAITVDGDLDTVLGVTAQCFQFSAVAGIGIASPGLLDTAAGTVVECFDLPWLVDVDLAHLISRHGRAPAAIEHRARVQVLGDRWFGAGRGLESFASVSTGSTLGVGILYQGQVVAPAGGRSGAHMIIDARGEQCSCGARGCWKTIATSAWLAREAGQRALPTHLVALSAAAADDPAAADLLARYAENLAAGLATIQHLFAPGTFIVHGAARAAGSDFLDRVEQRLREVTSWSRQAADTRIVPAEADDDHATLLGAAGLALSRT